MLSGHNLCFEQKYDNYQSFLSENFKFLEVKFSIYLNRCVFVMDTEVYCPFDITWKDFVCLAFYFEFIYFVLIDHFLSEIICLSLSVLCEQLVTCDRQLNSSSFSRCRDLILS